LYYYGARYYDPTIGRFITRDPVKGNTMNPQSLNPYVYCLNNPMKYIDPNGEWHIGSHDLLPDGDVEVDPATWDTFYDPELREKYHDEWAKKNSGSSGRKHSYRTWRGIKYAAPKTPVNSWGVEATGSYAYFAGQGGGHGWVWDENGNRTSYNIYQEGWGLGGGGDVSLFSSSLDAEEIANSVSKTYEISAEYFNVQVSLNESGDIVKFNIGLSGGCPFGFYYWDYVKTSPKGLISWLKDIF